MKKPSKSQESTYQLSAEQMQKLIKDYRAKNKQQFGDMPLKQFTHSRTSSKVSQGGFDLQSKASKSQQQISHKYETSSTARSQIHEPMVRIEISLHGTHRPLDLHVEVPSLAARTAVGEKTVLRIPQTRVSELGKVGFPLSWLRLLIFCSLRIQTLLLSSYQLRLLTESTWCIRSRSSPTFVCWSRPLSYNFNQQHLDRYLSLVFWSGGCCYLSMMLLITWKSSEVLL